ncbi:YxeA family protein [Lentibacillus salicampi]|uniref:YxeA family protein n=1 Tax=Lentibacillus salicampi TaxID=175306 RepID=A0A4Y9A6Z9_9BACI|nr:YxeA family protein [Lentibacillus salicampi]TFJ91498.1 YxeA family protein [Lentibacillus salicampi]
MKKLKGIGIGIVVILILIVGYTFLPQSMKGVLDRGNPLISQIDVYVQINKQPEKVSHRYGYSLKGYTSDGNEKKVSFTTSTTLPSNTYLRVDAKGSYVKNWEKVNFDNLPSKVKEEFEE